MHWQVRRPLAGWIVRSWGKFCTRAGPRRAGHAMSHRRRFPLATGWSIIERVELRGEFEASVLDYAKAESASRLAPIAKRRAEWFADTTFDDRHRRARDGRRTWVDDLDDGMSELRLVGPTVLVHASFDRLTQFAHAARSNTCSDAATADPDTDDTVEPRHRPEGDPRHRQRHRPGARSHRRRHPRPVRKHDPRRARPHRHRHRTNPRRGRNGVGSDLDAPGHRSRPRGRPLHPQRAAPSAPSHQRPALPVPRLPHAHPAKRHRPHARLRPRWADHQRKPRSSMSTTSHAQTPHLVDGGATSGRSARMDQPQRHLLPRQARQCCRLRGRLGIRVRDRTFLSAPGTRSAPTAGSGEVSR